MTNEECGRMGKGLTGIGLIVTIALAVINWQANKILAVGAQFTENQNDNMKQVLNRMEMIQKDVSTIATNTAVNAERISTEKRKNERQDVMLNDHEKRIGRLEGR